MTENEIPVSPPKKVCSHPVVSHDNFPYSLINKYISFAKSTICVSDSTSIASNAYFALYMGMSFATCCPLTWLPVFQTKSCEKRNGIVKVFNAQI